MPGRAIVFDLDGTLVDTAPDLWRATNHVLASVGRPAIGLDHVKGFVGHGARALIRRGLEATGGPLSAPSIDALYERFVCCYAADIAGGSQAFPGAEALLKRLSAEGLCLGVCTNKLEGLSEQLLDALDMRGYFGAVVGSDTLGISKPDAAPYRETLRRLGDAAMPSLMVGDSETDVSTARAAGVPVIAVTFGYTPRPVAEFAPDGLIDHFDALWPMIARLLP